MGWRMTRLKGGGRDGRTTGGLWGEVGRKMGIRIRWEMSVHLVLLIQTVLVLLLLLVTQLNLLLDMIWIGSLVR